MSTLKAPIREIKSIEGKEKRKKKVRKSLPFVIGKSFSISMVMQSSKSSFSVRTNTEREREINICNKSYVVYIYIYIYKMLCKK